MALSALKYKIRFNKVSTPPSLEFYDLIAGDYNTVHGLTLADIKGMIKITSPIGVIFANPGYDADDYSAPDIKGAVTAIWSVTAIALPLDTDGDVIKGDYMVEFKLSTDGSTTYLTDDLTYNYQFIDPVPVVTPTVNVGTSRMTVVDGTVYTVEGKEPVNTLTTDRLMTVKYPITSGKSDATSAAATFNVSGNLWSGGYLISLDTPLTYEMAAWADLDASVDVVTEILGETQTQVEDSDCACTYYNCMVSIDEKYALAKLNGNLREADRLLGILNAIDFYHNMYQLAVTCGEDYTNWCTKIQALAQSENCLCPEDSGSSESEEIIPVTTPPGTGSTGFQPIITGSGAPSNSSGVDDQLYVRTDTGYIYKKISGVWSSILKVVGNDGADGAAAIAVLSNYIGESKSNGTSEMDLQTFVLDNTPTPILKTNGDVLHIVATFKLAANDNGKRLKLYFASNIIAEYFTDSDVDVDNNIVQMEAWLSRVSAAVVGVKCNVIRGGQPGNVRGLTMDEDLAEDLTADITVKATGQNTVNALGEIACMEFKVEYLPSA
jgi:hypothetical protein